jgi:hypothetical protein
MIVMRVTPLVGRVDLVESVRPDRNDRENGLLGAREAAVRFG